MCIYRLWTEHRATKHSCDDTNDPVSWIHTPDLHRDQDLKMLIVSHCQQLLLPWLSTPTSRAQGFGSVVRSMLSCKQLVFACYSIVFKTMPASTPIRSSVNRAVGACTEYSSISPVFGTVGVNPCESLLHTGPCPTSGQW